MSQNPPRDTALVLTVSGEWGHISRVDTTSVKQTYRLLPRTTIAGLLSAIVGRPRDSYYDIFRNENSSIAIVPNTEPSVQRMPELELTTNNTKQVKGVGTVVKREGTLQERQRNIYEWLHEPSYTLVVSVEDDTYYEELKTHLENGTSEFTPVLGKSECLASIEYHGEATLEESNENEVDSAVPVNDVTSMSMSIERAPAYNTKADSGGRKTEGYLSLAYSADPLSVRDECKTYKVETSEVELNVRFT